MDIDKNLIKHWAFLVEGEIPPDEERSCDGEPSSFGEADEAGRVEKSSSEGGPKAVSIGDLLDGLGVFDSAHSWTERDRGEYYNLKLPSDGQNMLKGSFGKRNFMHYGANGFGVRENQSQEGFENDGNNASMSYEEYVEDEIFRLENDLASAHLGDLFKPETVLVVHGAQFKDARNSSVLLVPYHVS